MILKLFIQLVTLYLLMLPINSLGEDDPKRGAVKAEICIGCHGISGISSDSFWPNLAGQKKGYLIKILNDYKSGVRFNNVMSPIAATLSEGDIRDVAAYYASLKVIH